jgi:DTW domain-containing protein YfiP
MTLQIGKRKTKDPCRSCGLHKSYCICQLIPNLVLATKVTLVIHKNELKRTTNTGQLALKALDNSEMQIVGEEGCPFYLESILHPQFYNLLFYPSAEAEELSADFLKSVNKPIHLIVPDGNWRQASKIHYRNKQLSQQQLPRVKINQPNTGQYFLRKESKPIGMATLEAIAQALGVIEGEEVKMALLKVYEAKLHNTLKARPPNN